MQALVKLALEPEWEPRFEANSYGFRPGRCTMDTIEALHRTLSKPGSSQWVLDADIAKCLDASSHYTSVCGMRAEEIWSSGRYLNSQAFCPSAVDVDRLELAALDTLQDGLT
jgi:hypothetical protein